MMQAMNTGHDGSMSTGHANSARDMMARLETMVLMGMDLPIPAIRGQLSSGLDLVVHLGRLRDRSRKLLEVDEVYGIPAYRKTRCGRNCALIRGFWRRQHCFRCF